MWVEWDTAAHTRYINAVLSEGNLVPSVAYPAGFAYEEFVAIFAKTTGIPVLTLQIYVLPLLTAFFIFTLSFVVFRRLVGPSWGLLAAFLLNAQADFLFATSRGSHEKMTLALILLVIWAVTILILPETPSRLPKPVVRRTTSVIAVSYIALLTLILTNMFFAWVLITGLLLAFLITWRSNRTERRLVPAGLMRLPAEFAVGIGVIYLFAFVYYAPAVGLQITLSTIGQTFVNIVGGREPFISPYSPVAEQWKSTYVWLGINLLTWVILTASMAVSVALLTKKWYSNQAPLKFLVALGSGFAIEVAASAFLDALSPGGIQNLQVRLLPILLIPAAPLSAMFFRRLFDRRSRFQVPVVAMVVVILIAGSVGSVLRATADPSVSVQTRSYTSGEQSALGWLITHRADPLTLWAGGNDRLYQLYVLDWGYPPDRDISFWIHHQTQNVSFLLQSPFTRGDRIEAPNVREHCATCSQVYSNGETSILYV